MDSVKFGSFLKKLRKEKGITQEQLAEHLNVTNRTISRWETGANLPDIDMLVILSNYYQIDIGELLDCERKKEEAQKEETEVFLKLANYSSVKESNLIKKAFFVAISGVIALGFSFLVTLKFVKSETNGGFILFSTILGFVIYCICMCAGKAGQNPQGYLTALTGGFGAVIVSKILFLFVFFKTGEYHNYGIAGLYYAFGIIIITFLIAGTITKLFLSKTRNKKSL